MNWRVGLLVTLAFTGGVVVLLAIVTRPMAPPPHEIFVNGHILTMDASGTIAEAVSVRDGRIEAVGRSEVLLEEATEQTSIVDLRGRTLMPGFVDAHGHFPGSGQTVFSADLNSPPIGDITTMSQLLERLERFARARPDGWLVGHGYDDTLIAEKRHPTRDDLDQVSMDRPVAVIHVSGHLAVAILLPWRPWALMSRRRIPKAGSSCVTSISGWTSAQRGAGGDRGPGRVGPGAGFGCNGCVAHDHTSGRGISASRRDDGLGGRHANVSRQASRAAEPDESIPATGRAVPPL